MRTILLLIVIVFVSCNSTETKKTAQQIIDDSIISSGLDKVANAKIEFEFRNRKYLASRNNGTFALERFTTKDSVTIHDILSNNDFERYRNDVKIQVSDSMKTRYSSSINSVHYFSVLPYGLNDSAVKKKMLDDVIIKEKEYYKIQVSFSEDGGGEDFEDVFVYWINKKTNFVDYLAYSFHVNGGGMRFREVYNEHIVNGIRLVDYNNYKPKNASTKLLDLDKAFENNGLEKLSEINLKNIKVELLDNN
jgi:hypothetical protein